MFFEKGLFQFTNFLERGINFRRNCFRTGRQFGVLGGTYPPKKYPSAPPRGGLITCLSDIRGIWEFSKSIEDFQT